MVFLEIPNVLLGMLFAETVTYDSAKMKKSDIFVLTVDFCRPGHT